MADTPDPDQKTIQIDLEESGLLWLFNQALLHDLGFHLAQVVDAEGNLYFELAGGGNRIWVDLRDPNEQFGLMHATFAYARERNGPDETGIELKLDPAICAHDFTLTLSKEKRVCPACDTVLTPLPPAPLLVEEISVDGLDEGGESDSQYPGTE